MNYSDLVNEVYTLTNRPDLVNETASAVKSATLRAHHVDYFYKDIVEMSYQFPVLQFWQQLQLSQLPGFRSLKYLRKFYPGTSPQNPPQQDGSPNNLPPLYGGYYAPGANLPDGRFFEIITPEEVLDSYGINRIDIAYIGGQTINLRSGDTFQTLLTGYYAHPSIIPANWNSWISAEFPYAIVFAAAATVFKTIGYDEQNQQYQALMQSEYEMLQMSNVLQTGS